MARFTAELPTGKPDDMVRFIADDFLLKEGFQQVTHKNEVVWKKGKGLMVAPQFIKYQTRGGNVHLEAWLKYAILPGVYCGEMGLDGAMGFAVKKVLKDRVDALARLLYQPVPGADATPQPVYAAAEGLPISPAFSTPVPPQAPGGYPIAPSPYMPGQPLPVAVHDPRDKALLGLIMGLVSVLGCFVPIVGVITGIAGIIFSNLGRKSTARTMAISGLILSILFLVVSILHWAAGFYLSMMALL